MSDFKVEWPKRGHDYIKEETLAVSELLVNENIGLTQGENVNKFEKEFGDYIGNDNCVAVMSAAHALDLIAIKIKSKTNKNKVLIPAHTYCATALSFIRQGFEIIWVDINPDSFTVDMDEIKNEYLQHDNIAALVIVHLYGYMSNNMQEIKNLCTSNEIILVEDCAQSLGAFTENSIHCGNFGDYSCFSFHAQKNLTTLGEGGMLVCLNKNEKEEFKQLRINGHFPFENKTKYWLPAMVDVVQTIESVTPLKSTMNESQALIGRLVLKRIDKLLKKRRDYALKFKNNVKFDSISFQKNIGSAFHAHHLLPIRVNSKHFDRDDVIEILSTHYGIQAIVQFYPLNRYDFFVKNDLQTSKLKETDLFFDNMLSLPFSPTISESEINYMIDSFNETINKLIN